MKLPHKHYEDDNNINFMIEEDRANEIAKVFKQLGDPKRLQIFWLLYNRKECVINIAAIMNMSSPAVSHHLKVLKLAGLVTSKREGKEMFYKVSDNEISKFMVDAIRKSKNL